MEEFKPSSSFGIGNGGVRVKFRRLESAMEEFEPSSRLGIGNGAVRVKFRRFKSGMEDFEPSYDTWNREWRSLSQVPTLGIGNGGVQA